MAGDWENEVGNWAMDLEEGGGTVAGLWVLLCSALARAAGLIAGR